MDEASAKSRPVLSDLRTGLIQIGKKGEPNDNLPTPLHTL